MKLTTTSPITISRFHKRSSKGSSYKKFLINQKSINGVKREVLRETSLRNHSDDSLLGEENNADYLYNSAIPHPSVFKFTNSQKRPTDDSFLMSSKRHRVVEDKEYDLDNTYSFPVSHVTLPNTNSVCVPSGMQTSVPPASKAIRRSLVQTKRSSTPVTLSSQLSSSSRNGKFGLQILNQPEQQHRARYQTEGSRGAVKDRTGNSFPVVKVTGYNRPTTLQVFIGSDQGRVTPHMFYQACRVTGKNSTPCVEKNVEGTIVIEIDLEPSKDMTVTCDCVGILKERNVDVEHRFPEECSTRSKKKSTRCRMVFRTVITNDDGSTETLQIASQPIACTQPPGIPEICKKSLTHCQVSGGKELFVLGKNFLKDTHVRFYTDDWEQTVTPDKEFLQQTHLVCVVPAYRNLDINEPIAAKIAVISGNRSSEPHSFTFTPVVANASPSPSCSPLSNRLSPITECLDSGITKPAASTANNTTDSDSGLNKTTENSILKTSNSSSDDCENVNPSVLLWPTSNNLSSATARNCSTYNVQNANSKMMTSPAPLLRPSAIALGRRPSIQTIVPNSMGSAPASAAEVLSNLTSVATCSPCQSTGGIVPHYPDAASIPNYFQETERVMADYASNPVAYRNAALSDIVDPLALKSPIIVPKLEPRSDVSFQSQAASASTEFPCSGGVIASGIKSSMTSPPAGSCAMSASDLYSKSQSAYSVAAAAAGAASSDMYGGKHVTVVDSLSTFGDGNSGNGIGADPCGVLSTSGASCSSPGSSSSSSVEASTYASLVNGGAGTSYAVAAATAAAALMSPPTSDRGYIKNEELPGMVTMAGGESAYDQMNAASDLKNKTYQLNQMFDMKSKTLEQQQRASYENLQAAGAICYKNTLMGVDQAQTNTALSIYQQNYQNFASTGSISENSSNSSDVVEVTSKIAASQQSPIMDSMVGASAMGCVESSSSMMLDDGKLTSTCTTSPIQQQCTKNASSSLDDCSFLNVVTQAQQHQSVNEAYVSSANIDPVDSSNFINSVPKLEELVNNAAENHIRSANMTALAVLGADHAANDRSAAAAASISLNMFLSSSSSASSQANEAALNCNQSVVVSSGNSCGVMSNSTSSLLSPYQHLMGPVSNKMPSASDQLVQMKNIGHTNNTTDKSDNNVAGLIKKPDDAVFASEITRMTENDLLSYINPSCFDQVATIASIVAEHLQT